MSGRVARRATNVYAVRAAEIVLAHGRWSFTVNRIIGGESEVVSDVSITDGTQNARAISFFTVAHGKITRLVEFWPEPYEAPSNRKHLVEAIE